MRDEDDDVFSMVFADHKRLVAERFRRIWQLVEDIASHPGKSRKITLSKPARPFVIAPFPSSPSAMLNNLWMGSDPFSGRMNARSREAGLLMN